MTTIEDQRLDALFTALSDRTRRDIVSRLSVGEATVKGTKKVGRKVKGVFTDNDKN